MPKFDVTYADGSTEQITFDGKAKQLAEQLFSHCSEEVREKCKVVLVKEPVKAAVEGK